MPRSRSRSIVLLVFLVLGLVYGLGRALSPKEPVQGDGYYTWLWARSLAFDGDFNLRDDYARCGDPWRMAPRGTGPLPGNQWTIGPALVWAPVAAVGRLLFPTAAGCRGPVADFAMFGTVLMALLALWLGYRMARRYVSTGPALFATVGVALASPLPYYAIFLPSYSHVPAAFGVALFLERWDATRGDRRVMRWLLMGALLALAMLMRPQMAVLAVCPLIEWLVLLATDVRGRRGNEAGWLVVAGLVFLLGTVVGYAPQLALTRQMYGSPFAVPQGPYYMRWSDPSVAGALFGTTGGLLFWTPFLYLSAIGLFVAAFRRDTRMPGLGMLLVFAATVYVNAAVWDWWGSMGFSNRRFVALSGPFVFGAAVAVDPVLRWIERRPARAMGMLVALVLGAFATWNFAAMTGVADGDIASWREQPADQAWESTFRELAAGVERSVGNPLSWPASIPFALHYHVHPSHWDAMQGMSVLYLNYEDMAPRVGEESVDFDKPLRRQYLVGGFEVQHIGPHWAAVSTGRRGRMLIPLFMGAARGIELHWRVAEGRVPARVELTWNHLPVTQADVRPGPWQKLFVAIPETSFRTGVNDVVWSFRGAPVAIQTIRIVPAKWLPPARRMGQKPWPLSMSPHR